MKKLFSQSAKEGSRESFYEAVYSFPEGNLLEVSILVDHSYRIQSKARVSFLTESGWQVLHRMLFGTDTKPMPLESIEDILLQRAKIILKTFREEKS